MKRWVLSALALTTCTLLSASPFAYVTNYYGNSVGILDLATNAMTGYVNNASFTITNPSFVIYTPDGTKAYLLTEDGSNAAFIIDPSMNTVTSQVNTSNGPFDGPAFMAFTPDGTKAYVSNESGNSISIIDVSTDTVTGYVNTNGYPFNGPYGIAISPDGSTAYVANFLGANFSIIDVATDTVRGYLTPPCSGFIHPVGAVFVSDTLAYVSDPYLNSVYSIDVTNSIVSGQFDIGSNFFDAPEFMYITSDGDTALILGDGGTLNIADISSNTVTAVLTTGFGATRYLSITSDNSTAYYPIFGNNAINIVDISTATVTGTVDTSNFPLDAPFSISIQP